MGNISERLRVAMRRSRGMREAALVALAFALPSLSARELAHLTVQDACSSLQGRKDLPARLALTAIKRLDLPNHALVFRSRKGRGEKPAHRITLWRVLKATIGGGFRALRKILTTQRPQRPATTPLSDLKGPMTLSDLKGPMTLSDLMVLST